MARFSAAFMLTLPVAAAFLATPALAQRPLPPPGVYEERLPPVMGRYDDDDLYPATPVAPRNGRRGPNRTLRVIARSSAGCAAAASDRSAATAPSRHADTGHAGARCECRARPSSAWDRWRGAERGAAADPTVQRHVPAAGGSAGNGAAEGTAGEPQEAAG